MATQRQQDKYGQYWMNSAGKESYTGDEIIYELAHDPFFGARLFRADTGEPYVHEGDPPDSFLIHRKGDRLLQSETEEPDELEQGAKRVLIYEAESEQATSILNSIYENLPDGQNFRSKFMRLPCKGELLRQLVFAWCGLLGLPYTRNGLTPENPEADILDNWMRDFAISREDLKSFLRRYSWPLPVNIYGNEPDNTERKVSLSDKEFEEAAQLHINVLPDLQKQLDELENIQPASFAEQQLKNERRTSLANQISAIKSTESALYGKTGPVSRRLERSLETAIRHLGYQEQYKELKREYPDKTDVWISKKIAKQQKGAKVSSGTIRRVMKSHKS